MSNHQDPFISLHVPQPPFKGAILVEPHAHAAEVSGCSYLPAAELVALVARHGYGAVVITDHYLARLTDTQKGREAFRRGYLLAKAAGDACGIAVLPGMELRFDAYGINDFLVYLPDPACYARLRDIASLSPERFRRVADEEGLLVYQAHPFRTGQTVQPPAYLHGIEVHNGNPNHDSHNEQALAYAKAHGLAMVAGSDLHGEHGVHRGGIWVPPEAIASPKAFVAHLRATPQPPLFCPPLPAV